MKYARFVKLGAYGVALAAVLSFSTAQAEVGQAIVRAVRGSASYSDGAGAWNTLKVGKVLKPGAKVRTDTASQVDLFLGDNGPVVRVTESTTLGFDKLNFENTGADTVIETQLDLSSGRILGSVKKMAAASKYEVKTPVGVAGIRGTDYDISANGVTRVLKGSVVMVYSQPGKAPITQVINTGEQFNPNSNSPNKVEIIPPNVLTDSKQQLQNANNNAGGGPTNNGPIAQNNNVDNGKVESRPNNEETRVVERPYGGNQPFGSTPPAQ